MKNLHDIYKHDANIKFDECSDNLISHLAQNMARLSLGPKKYAHKNDLFSAVSILNSLLSVTDFRRTMVNKVLAEYLIETKSCPLSVLSASWAFRINYYMLKHDHYISYDPNTYNIVYLEGVDSSLICNSDSANEFNDLRALLSYKQGLPTLEKYWDATTEPGTFYTHNPMNPKGAARIAFGQYKAWKVGFHNSSPNHPALVQVSAVSVYRDRDKDFSRVSDPLDIGLFGINQHHGYNMPTDNIGKASAGCLVGRSENGHKEFMKYITSDARYLKDKNTIFPTSILPGDSV